jgi:methylated-DNA-[protein]-cysteine S-methyltransferase
MKTFTQNVYDITKQIPKGKVTTYKEIAHALNTKAYRAVGTALHNNPTPHYHPQTHSTATDSESLEVPCHRVVKSNGEIGGFAFGKHIKKQLLEQEGITIKNNKLQNFKKVLITFK